MGVLFVTPLTLQWILETFAVLSNKKIENPDSTLEKIEKTVLNLWGILINQMIIAIFFTFIIFFTFFIKRIWIRNTFNWNQSLRRILRKTRIRNTTLTWCSWAVDHPADPAGSDSWSWKLEFQIRFKSRIRIRFIPLNPIEKKIRQCEVWNVSIFDTKLLPESLGLYWNTHSLLYLKNIHAWYYRKPLWNRNFIIPLLKYTQVQLDLVPDSTQIFYLIRSHLCLFLCLFSSYTSIASLLWTFPVLYSIFGALFTISSRAKPLDQSINQSIHSKVKQNKLGFSYSEFFLYSVKYSVD